ncbi:xre family transcriptional regulator [Leptolyngbya sp. Heron Island J]|uniref:helix-turn-helix domain-containing protein n=1 Tax=Leptolyngbya sp. Heron Island J TaxID=1385935 RepID=UPI0003B98176|nr:helix-turn-helix transcriptional regulator [Leptolyngbya sp. Heron Island J]ESA38470.1 xre family transcriptional regulator [Leptolyngbya sp. Heron Island J]
MAVMMKVRKDVDFPGLGGRIKEAREELQRQQLPERLSVAKIATDAGMTPANWYKIENEDTKVLPLETLREIERVLGVSFGVSFDQQPEEGKKKIISDDGTEWEAPF